MTYESNIFTQILNGEVPSPRVFENEIAIAINDINPVAKTHVLVIPRKEVSTIADLDATEFGALMQTAVHVAEKVLELPSYKLVMNAHKPMQEVPHVHVHIVSEFGK